MTGPADGRKEVIAMSKLTREEMDRIINEHFQYEAQDDVDGFVSTLTEDVEPDVVGSPGRQVRGWEAARKYYAELFSNLKGGSVQPVRRLYGDNLIIDETVWTRQLQDPAPSGLSRWQDFARECVDR